MSSCQCACHVSSGSHVMTCTVDTGSSGVPGVPSCSPCDGGGSRYDAPTAHERSGSRPAKRDGEPCSECGAFGVHPHGWTEGTCILPHNYDRPEHPPRANVGHICRGCVERLRDWLTEIIELYAGLPDVIEPGSVPDDTAAHGHVKKRPASPAPMRLDAWAMVHDRERLYRTGHGSDLPDVPAVVADLAYRVGDDLGVVPPGDLGETLSGSVTFIAGRIEAVASSPWIDELDAELRWVRRMLRQAHGNPQPLGRCISVVDGRDCGGQVWPSKRQHDPRPECNRCHRRYDERDVARLTISQDREARREARTGTNDARPRIQHAADGAGRA